MVCQNLNSIRCSEADQIMTQSNVCSSHKHPQAHRIGQRHSVSCARSAVQAVRLPKKAHDALTPKQSEPARSCQLHWLWTAHSGGTSPVQAVLLLDVERAHAASQRTHPGLQPANIKHNRYTLVLSGQGVLMLLVTTAMTTAHCALVQTQQANQYCCQPCHSEASSGACCQVQRCRHDSASKLLCIARLAEASLQQRLSLQPADP